MSVTVELPALGESIVEGTVSRWLVKEGDRVEADQPLVEVSTDKVDAESPAPRAGVVEKILVAEGETIQVGAPLVTIDPAGAGAEPPPAGAPPVARVPAAPASPAAARAVEEPVLRATPVARRMAQEASVDLSAVEGTGPAGRVTKRDLVRHSAEPPAPAPAPREVPPPTPIPTATRVASEKSGAPSAAASRAGFLSYALQPGDRVIPMSPLRRLVAEHMVLSKRTRPHVGTVAEIDLGGVSDIRDRHKREFKRDHGYALSFLPFMVHATVRALREFPRLNASALEDSIVEKKDIHIGIAVETEKGLIVPVVRHADRLSLAGLAQAVEDIATRARTKRLSADELKGGTFTISNPGRFGNLYGFAIINQPQVGILRMGEIVKRPVVRSVDGQDAITIRPMMYLALSYDHRAVDGAPANAFLYRVRELLEEAEFDL